MAAIYYWTTKGSANARPIFGVHPDENALVPPDVACFTVTGDPVWPVPLGYLKGTEQTSVIDTTTTPNTIVVSPTVPVAPMLGRDFLKSGLIANLSGANAGARLDRLSLLILTDHALAMIVNVLNTYSELTAGDMLFIRKCWARKLSANGLTNGEVTAIEAAAVSYGLTLP